MDVGASRPARGAFIPDDITLAHIISGFEASDETHHMAVEGRDMVAVIDNDRPAKAIGAIIARPNDLARLHRMDGIPLWRCEVYTIMEEAEAAHVVRVPVW